MEIVWRTDNNKFRIDHKENAGTTHTDEREYMTQLVSRLMAFDIDFYFRIAKVSVSAAKVKLNL